MFPWILATVLLVVSVLLGLLLKKNRDTLDEEKARLAALQLRQKQDLKEIHEEHAKTLARIKRETAQIKASAHLPLAKDLFEGLDALDMALDNAQHHPNTTKEDLLSGLSMAQTSLHKALAKHDVTPINPTPGSDSFDPKHHEAISVTDDANLPPNSISNVMRKGWTHPNKVLRPAMVQTTKSSAPQSVISEPDEPTELDFTTDEHQEDTSLDFEQEEHAAEHTSTQKA